MRTFPGTSANTARIRRPLASSVAVLCLALPLTAALTGVAGAADSGTGVLRAAADGSGSVAVVAAPGRSVDHGKSVTAGDNGRPNEDGAKHGDTTAFVGPVALTVAGPSPTPFANQGGVTTGSNTTSYETVVDGKGSTVTGVGGGQPSGDIKSPQPLSNADKSDTGANDTSASNPYRSTRDGSPSLNGNGGGNQVGQPCAGCVGKADNKNPPGQAPNATDGNAGYECDRNHGIGRSNPAHTGCPAPKVVTCPPGTTMTSGGCKPPTVTVCPAGSTQTAHGCQTPPSGGSTGGATAPGVTPPVTGPVVGRGTQPVIVPLGPVPPARRPTTPPALPFTGPNSLRLLELAGLLLLAGVGLVVSVREPAPRSQ